MQIKLLRFSDKDFEGNLKDCLEFDSSNNEQIMDVAKNILLEIKEKGDKALIGFTKQFDSLNIENALSLEITPKDINTAFNNISQDQKKALEEAASRIFEYHKKQKNESWSYEDAEGSLFGQKVTPLDRVGLYVPGGKAAYPSSVLMNAIPAKVAGVQELIMVVPTPNGERNDLVLAAAKVAQVDRIFSIGGAQAIGALAYGTETIPKTPFTFCPLISPEVVSTKKLWSFEDMLLEKPKIINVNSNKFFIMYLTKSIILHQIFGM